jgi:protein-disulfide isomerase
MEKRFWAVIGIIIIAFAGAIWISSNKQSPTSSAGAQPTNHILGNTQAKVKLVEYGDYECPYCAQYYPIINQIATEYGSQISFQFRNLPITQIHPNAFAAARAAEAAGLQGKFWQMHDLLYAQNIVYYDSGQKDATWVGATNSELYFIQYATELGLNTTQFQKDYASTTVNNLINADVSAFTKTGLTEATPTFFLNGTQIQPVESIASFESYINAALKQQGITPNPTTT